MAMRAPASTRRNPAESEAQAAAGLDRFAEVATMYALVVRETREVAGFVGFVPRTMEWETSSSSGGCCYRPIAAAAMRPRPQQRSGRSKATAWSR
jgi:hypothetical protein